MTTLSETAVAPIPPQKLILVIDDAANMRELLQYLLEKHQLRIVSATNGQEALLRLAEESMPAAVFVDWNMPGMSGLEFVETVRIDDRYRAMPIVMVTGCQVEDGVNIAFKAGVNKFVAKPFRVGAIAEVLRELQLIDS
jgi:CheY-like chemotaxis protein